MWSSLLEVLFPKKCVQCKTIGTFLCSNCFSRLSFHESPVCPICLRGSVTGSTHLSCQTRYRIDGLLSAYTYQGPVKKLVYKLKYKPYLSSLAPAIGQLFVENLEQQEKFHRLLQTSVIICPIPLHPKKEKIRGYNHASLLSSYVAQYYGVPHINDLVVRVKETKPQFKLSKEDRSTNIKGAFRLNSKYEEFVMGKTVFMIDDVATTCTTLREAAKVLKYAGAKRVWGITFAKEI